MESLFDPQAVAEAQGARTLTGEYAEYLRTFRWDFWATGTLKAPVTRDTLLEIGKQWLSPFRDAYAAVGLQRGPTSLSYHVHMLVGGIGHASLNALGTTPDSFLRGHWVRDGHVHIEQFSPALLLPEYLIAQAEEIEILGSPVLYKPRHNRGRRGRTRGTVKGI